MKRPWLVSLSTLSFALVALLVEQYGSAVPSESVAQSVVEHHDVRALPGKLNKVPVLNSNSPEVVQSEGILVSTLPSTPGVTANLNFAFSGRFDVFAHHIAKSELSDPRVLYLGVLLFNAGKHDAKVDILSGASYLSQPDAPFVSLPNQQMDNTKYDVFAGPGDRVMLDVLRGTRSGIFPKSISVPAGKSYMLASLPIPVQGLTPPLNGRSLLVQLRAARPVYAATLAMFSKAGDDGIQRAPTLIEWADLLSQGQLAGPREKEPTPPGAAGPIVYGRVGGVSMGSAWEAQLSDRDGNRTKLSEGPTSVESHTSGKTPILVRTPTSVRSATSVKHSTSYQGPVAELSIAPPGGSISYPISSVVGGTFGTKQVQSAPMLVREENTAYQAHGNYGVKYDIKAVIVNHQPESHKVEVLLQSPLKKDVGTSELSFLEPPAPSVFFRGTIRLTYRDAAGTTQIKYIHIVEHRGERGVPLVELNLEPGQASELRVEFLYPPDATPPQVLTISTMQPPD